MDNILECPHFPACSGCTAIGEPYDLQLQGKLATVRQAFAQASLSEFDPNFITKIVPSTRIGSYRNRAELVPVRVGGDAIANAGADLVAGAERIKLGLYRAGSHEVVDIPGCPVQSTAINEAMEVIRGAIHVAGVSLYDEARHTGDLRFVTVREGAGTSQLLIGFVTRAAEFPGVEELTRVVTARCPRAVGVVQNINPEPGSVIFGSTNRVLAGRGYLEKIVASVRLRLGLTSFFQVNTEVTERAHQAIVHHLLLDRRMTLMDLYSGVGAVGLIAAGSVHRVVGIEESVEAVELAGEAAHANGIRNVEFRTGMVEDRLPRLVNDLRRAGVSAGRLTIVVTPPRKGLGEGVLGMLRRIGAVRVAYLSCSPRTLVRDLVLFLQGEYRIRHVELFDMFPQTDQVETLVIAERIRRVVVPARTANRRR